ESGRMSDRSGIVASTSSLVILGSGRSSTKYGPLVTLVADSHAADELPVILPEPVPDPVELVVPDVDRPPQPARSLAKSAIPPHAKTTHPHESHHDAKISSLPLNLLTWISASSHAKADCAQTIVLALAHRLRS